MKKLIACAILSFVSTNTLAENKEILLENSDWVVVKTVDPMTDETRCYIWGNGKSYYQVGKDNMYVGYQGRGGLRGPGYNSIGSLVRYRYDDETPSDYMSATKMEGDINALIIPIRSVTNKKRLRIQTQTLVKEVVDEDINLETLQPAIQKCNEFWYP